MSFLSPLLLASALAATCPLEPAQPPALSALLATTSPAIDRHSAPIRILIRPSQAPAARWTAEGHELWRAADGLFYVHAMVNGAVVRFLVDTGATAIVLTPDDARRAGVTPQRADYAVAADTANGRTAMAQVMLAEMAVGQTAARGVPAVVASDGLGVSLLGQSWLATLDTVMIEGDRMLLR